MKAIQFVIGAALLVGTLDILAAFIDYYIRTGNGPGNVLRYIASSVFGAAAFTGGARMVLVGLLFHYTIALIFTVLFYLIYPKVLLMAKHPVATGIMYGLFIWLVMSHLVLPNTKVKPGGFDWFQSIKAILILVIMIGLPLAFLTRKHFQKLHD